VIQELEVSKQALSERSHELNEELSAMCHEHTTVTAALEHANKQVQELTVA
jgi:hypothetical protein